MIVDGHNITKLSIDSTIEGNSKDGDFYLVDNAPNNIRRLWIATVESGKLVELLLRRSKTDDGDFGDEQQSFIHSLECRGLAMLGILK